MEQKSKRVYQGIVGTALSTSRLVHPGISHTYTVMHLTRAMSNSRDKHLVAAKRVLQYLKGNPHPCVGYDYVLLEDETHLYEV